MRRLESIHKEEMSSLERRLGEAESRCAKLELAKRDVAHKLHKVMENQWQQALGIITGELSLRQVTVVFCLRGFCNINIIITYFSSVNS